MRKILQRITSPLWNWNRKKRPEANSIKKREAPKKVVGNDLKMLSLPVPVFPATPPSRLIESEKDLVVKLRNVLGLSTEDTQTYLNPILMRYAETVHLLPASEIHHHRFVGGLLRHGLEVAFWSGQNSLQYAFEYQGKLSEKRQHTLRWRFAFILGGMLHDLGKTVNDMVVTDSTGQHVWMPFKESIWEWSERLKLEGYYVYWRKKRVHKQHESIGFPLANRVIGPEALTFLSAYDQELIPILFGLLSGSIDKENALVKSVISADSHSTKKDLERNGVPINTYLQGSPLDFRLVEIMRELSSNLWSTNQPESVIWHLPDGLFLDWDKAVEDINRMVIGMGFIGIPRDAGVLADTLIDSGVAKAYTKQSAETGEVKQYRYHPLIVKGKPEDEKTELEKINKSHDDHYMYALRIMDFSYVFNGPYPPVLNDKQVQSLEASLAPAHSTTELQSKESSLDAPLLLPALKSAETLTPTLNETSVKSVTEERFDTPPESSPEATELVPVIQKAPLLFDDLIGKLVQHQGEPPPLDLSPSLELNENCEQEESDPANETESTGQEKDTNISEDTELVLGLTLPSAYDVSSTNEIEEKTVATVSFVAEQEQEVDFGLTLPSAVAQQAITELSISDHEVSQPSKELILPPIAENASTKTEPEPVAEPELTSAVDPDPDPTSVAELELQSEPLLTIHDWIKDYTEKIQQKTQPPITDWLLQLTLPIFKQEAFLGEKILLLQGQLYVCYPQGIDQNNQADEMVSLLAQKKVIVPDPMGSYIHDQNGQLGLRFEPSLSDLITRVLKVVAELVDPLNQDDSDNQQQETHTTDELDAVPSYFDEIPPIPMDEFDENQIVMPVAEMAMPDFNVGNSELYTEPSYLEETSKPEIEAETFNVDVEDQRSEDEDPGEDGDEASEEPFKPLDKHAVIQELIEMIKAGEGRWIEEEVKREGGKLVVSDRCLHRIVEDYPNDLTIESLKKTVFFMKKNLVIQQEKVILG